MRNATDKTWNRVLMASLAFLIALIVLYTYVGSATQKNLLDNKCAEVENELGMIAAAVNADPDEPWDSHRKNIVDSMGWLDKQPFTFAAMYAPEGEELTLLTERDNATNFDPREFDVFNRAISKNDRGSLVIGFTPTGMKYRDMHLYYLWVPDYSWMPERYLLVAAVSEYSITVKLAQWITIALQAGVIVLSAFFGWLFYLKVELGVIIAMRKGNTLKDKHRSILPAADEVTEPSGSDQGEWGD